MAFLGTTCRRCQWIRAFLGLAVLLIVMIGLQPQAAMIIAGKVPAPIVLAVAGMIFGTLAFAFRFWAWYKYAP